MGNELDPFTSAYVQIHLGKGVKDDTRIKIQLIEQTILKRLARDKSLKFFAEA